MSRAAASADLWRDKRRTFNARFRRSRETARQDRIMFNGQLQSYIGLYPGSMRSRSDFVNKTINASNTKLSLKWADKTPPTCFRPQLFGTLAAARAGQLGGVNGAKSTSPTTTFEILLTESWVLASAGFIGSFEGNSCQLESAKPFSSILRLILFFSLPGLSSCGCSTTIL